jgi:hypothetical protein
MKSCLLYLQYLILESLQWQAFPRLKLSSCAAARQPFPVPAHEHLSASTLSSARPSPARNSHGFPRQAQPSQRIFIHEELGKTLVCSVGLRRRIPEFNARAPLLCGGSGLSTPREASRARRPSPPSAKPWAPTERSPRDQSSRIDIAVCCPSLMFDPGYQRSRPRLRTMPNVPARPCIARAHKAVSALQGLGTHQ